MSSSSTGRGLRIALQEDADAVLRGEPLGQLVLRARGRLEVLDAELRDVEHVRQIDEHVPSASARKAAASKELSTFIFTTPDACRVTR